MTEVVITGFGIHCGFGDVSETWDSLEEKRTAVVPFQPEGVQNFPEVLAVPAALFDLAAYVPDRKLIKYMSSGSKLAVLAAGRALEKAGLLRNDLHRETMALFLATGPIAFDVSTVGFAAENCKTPEGGVDLKKMGKEGLRLSHPLMPFQMLLNMPLGLISIIFGIRGENFVVYPGADQAGIAIQTAWRGIKTGRFERALAGGTGIGLSAVLLAGLIRQDRPARPGRANPNRWIIADQAGFLVLESRNAAMARGALPIATLDGPHLKRPAERNTEAVRAMLEGGDIPRPDLLLVTGCSDPADQQKVDMALDELWPGGNLFPLNLDNHLGYSGPASLPVVASLAAEMTRRHCVPGHQNLKPPQECLILSLPPGESLFSCRIRGIGGPQ